MGNNVPVLTDWLMVLITTIYVVATIAICYFNYRTMKASNDQIEEMREEFYNINRPIIVYSQITLKNRICILQFTNNGNQGAFNVGITIKEEFIKSVDNETIRKHLSLSNEKVFNLGVGQKYIICLGVDNENLDFPIIGGINYEGVNGSIYYEDIVTDRLNCDVDYFSNTNKDDILKRIKSQNDFLSFLYNQIDDAKENNGDSKKKMGEAKSNFE